MAGQSDLNERIAGIAPSLTLAITSKAKAMAKAGKDVCSFAAGEPDFDTPAPIKRAAAAALDAGETKYTPVPGLPALREAIAEKLQRENDLAYETDQIIVSNGAKHSLFNIFMALCRDGDEVIVPAPYWLSYPEMIRVAGGQPAFVQTDESLDFKMTPDQLAAAVTPRSKAVILNSPSNPVGCVYTEEELRAVTDVALAHNLYIVADEIYEKMLYDGACHASVAGFSDEAFNRTITVNGFSKAYAMTGWRLGYFAAPLPIAKAASALQSHSTSGANTFAQFGAIEALRGPQDCVNEMLKAFTERRAYLLDRLTAIDGVTCVKPMGAFYMLPNIAAFGLDSVTFADRLLDEQGVAVTPGAAFGADQNVRLSYACSMDNIERGMDRLETFVQSL